MKNLKYPFSIIIIILLTSNTCFCQRGMLKTNTRTLTFAMHCIEDANVDFPLPFGVSGFFAYQSRGVDIKNVNAALQDAKTVVYLIPGQGADARQFNLLEIDQQFEVRNIEYFTPEKGCKMHEFAQALAQQIDTTGRFVIIGVSLGGMLATEMGDFLHPEKIIIISSAKHRNELPGRYTFQKSIPIYKLVTAGMTKWGAKFLQPLVEPDSKNGRDVFLEMLNDKDPDFLKRTAAMIIRWERNESRVDIVHIHGDNDHTIPIRNVDYDYLIEDGSHMMVYTRADEISDLINKILIGG